MHFEVLIEDASGKIAVEYFLSDILGANGQEHSWKIIEYKGVGRIPKNLNSRTNPANRVLLNHLPKLLQGYGKTFRSYGDFDNYNVIVVVDLDNKSLEEFQMQLNEILDQCSLAPNTIWGIAIEEGEAWLLGDRNAIEEAYPSVKKDVLDSYQQDSICGTWEKLADAIYPGGSVSLKTKSFWEIGKNKCEWAENISPLIDTENNQSPSFQVLRQSILSAIGADSTEMQS